MAEQKKLHIAVFPWLAFGHMTPYLELSKLIAKKGHKISFISTPRNIDRLPKLPPHLSSHLQFIKLPMPYMVQLPENAEATGDVLYNEVKYLKLAHDGLQEPLAQFLQESVPDCILFDFASYWVPSVAKKLGITSAYLSIFISAFLGFMGPVDELKGIVTKRTKPEDFTRPPEWVNFETTVAFKLFEILRIFDIVTGDGEGFTDTFRAGTSIEGCDFLAIRDCSEFNPQWLNLVEDLHGKPVIPIGQLPTTGNGGTEDENDGDWIYIKKWLDKQEKRLVLYVAFGSEAKPSQSELTEIALGLELSGLPFFWVLRTKRGSSDEDIVSLPEGFEDRVKNRGLVWTSWAPQLKILSHDSVGGILTHSGWSSVVEAIQFEKALILLTFLADQGINARILEEKKIGYPIPRSDKDGSFTRDSVAESLSFVIVKEEGKAYREIVKELKKLFCDEIRQDHYLDNLLERIQAMKVSKQK